MRSRGFAADGGPSGADWAARLPRLLAELLDDWGLAPTGAGMTGWTAVVVPRRLATATGLALKLVWPHSEATARAPGAAPLGRPRGGAAGRGGPLARGPAARGARPHPRPGGRRHRPACEVVGEPAGRAECPCAPRCATLSDFARGSSRSSARSEGLLPRRMVERTDRAGARPHRRTRACDATLLHTDLHYENVLASLRGSGRPDGWRSTRTRWRGTPASRSSRCCATAADELGTGSAFRWSSPSATRDLSARRPASTRTRRSPGATSHAAIPGTVGGRRRRPRGLSLHIALLKALDG